MQESSWRRRLTKLLMFQDRKVPSLGMVGASEALCETGNGATSEREGSRIGCQSDESGV